MNYKFTLILLILTFSLPVQPETSAEENRLVVIVNGNNPTTELTTEQITDYYLKRKRQWPDGSPVRFIDRDNESGLKNLFLTTIVKKTNREVDTHWIGQKLFSGDSAPLQTGSDSMSVSLVARFKGAIGYISSDYPLTKNVKKIEIPGGSK